MSNFYERYWEGDASELSDFSLKWPILLPYIPKDKEVTVLDFGCGKGHILSEILYLNPKAKLIGCDVSEAALQVARVKVPKAVFHKIIDGGAIPLPNSSVDFVFSSEVIEHIYDTENAVSEISRVLKSGGKALITVPYHGFLKNLMIIFLGFDTHFDPVGPHVRFFSKRTMTKLLKQNGFEIEKYDYYGRFRPFSKSMVVLARKK
ncbi:MAG: class I SAM-dependent methyltransferase [Candidatus Paceibacterota bacterium]|jgi:SAM-dependent methyltransferase